MQPVFEVADVLEKLGVGIENLGLNNLQLRTLWAIKRCRTAQMGGHVDACDSCGNISVSYNSCRNRHCRYVGPPNAKAIKEKNGYRPERPIYCQCPIFMLFLRYPMPSIN